MCGISGWVDLVASRAADRGLVQAMNEAIRHRGPDGEGFHYGPGVALGHRRLSIIDLALGAQPMFNETGTVAIVFNGEIYNFAELRRELLGLGHRFATQSDTEVIVHGWEEWGGDVATRLRGMFAFALWDAAEETLFLARDRMGEKPLYYARLPDDTLVFASELKALMVWPALRREIDPCAVEEFFALGYVAEPRTIYRTVERLPAGGSLTIRRGQAPVARTYWDLKPAAVRRGPAEALARELADRLGGAVRAQLVSDVPVGAFLSGGIDSGGVVALMAGAAAEPVRAFTIGFDDPAYDESDRAAAVAAHYGARHTVERIDGTEPDLVARLPGIFDEPFGDSSALPTYRVMQLAGRHVKVALSGDGGDELFAGYRRYAFHRREEALRAFLPAGLRRAILGPLSRLYPQLDWAPRAFRARHTLRELSLDSAEGFLWNVSVTDDDLRRQLFTPELARALGGYGAAEVIRRHMVRAPSDDPVAIAQYVDLKTWLPGDILTKTDRTSMACSLEVRVPFLDHELVEWAFGLPRDLLIRGGNGKAILKQALQPFLPAALLARRKQGFSVPLADWFRQGFGDQLTAALRRGGEGAASAFVDPGTVDRLIAEHRGGRHDHGRVLWLLWIFQRFLAEVHAAPARQPAKASS